MLYRMARKAFILISERLGSLTLPGGMVWLFRVACHYHLRNHGRRLNSAEARRDLSSDAIITALSDDTYSVVAFRPNFQCNRIL